MTPPLRYGLLRKQGYIVGVISGNPRPKGEALLRFTDLEKCIDFTAFFDDPWKGTRARVRADILRLLIQKVNRKKGINLSLRQVVVIGDAPSDIKAGKEIGAHTIGVATGNYSMTELETQRPDRVLRAFTELPGVLTGSRIIQPQKIGKYGPRVHIIQKSLLNKRRAGRRFKPRIWKK